MKKCIMALSIILALVFGMTNICRFLASNEVEDAQNSFTSELKSSSSVIAWNETWGGDNGDIGNDVAVDGSGNVYVAGYTYSFGADNNDAFLVKYDQDMPSITINSPIDNQLFGTNAPTFELTIVEGNLDTTWYTIDYGITNITFTENGTISQSAWDALPEGNVVIKFYANDTLGRISSQEVTITKDVTAPIITINNPQNNDIIGATAPSFNISINEPNLDTVWYSLNGGTNLTFTGLTGTINQTLWDALPEGNVVVRFYANDTLGRKRIAEVTVVKAISQPTPPRIPGYDILLLLGITATIALIIVKKRLNHLN